MAEEKTESQDKGPPAGKGMFRLIMLVAVVVLASVAGAAVSMFLAASPDSADAAATEENLLDKYSNEENDGAYTYIVIEPVRANLDTPDLARYIQVVIKLAVRDDEDLVDLVENDYEANKEELTSWLNIYFAGCTLDEVRGSSNHNRILRDIRDEFNDALWRDKSPLIHHVVFQEINIQ